MVPLGDDREDRCQETGCELWCLDGDEGLLRGGLSNGGKGCSQILEEIALGMARGQGCSSCHVKGLAKWNPN